MPDGLSLSEGIEWIKKRYPHVYPIKENGEKSCYIKFKEKVIDQKSALDEKLLLDMSHWCVTLMNADNSNECPCTWMGHASLVIEAVEEEGYFIRSAHLTKTAEGKADIIFSEVPRKKLINWAKKVSKNETWSRPKKDIQRMIDQIFLEVTHQKNGDPLIFFKLDSGKMKHLAKMINLNHIMNQPATSDNLLLENVRENQNSAIFLKEQNKKIYNCIYYSLRNLSLANIHPSLQAGGVLSKVFFPTPALYTGSKIKAIVQESSLVTSYVALYSLPFMPAILSALARGNYRSVNQIIAITAGWGLADVIKAYSVYYFQGTRLGSWMDSMGVSSSKKQSEYKRREHEENTSLLNWFVNDFVGDIHKKPFKEIFFTKESLYKILKMIAVQKALRS